MTSGTMSESAPSNQSEIRWMISRLRQYLTPEDEPLIGELNEIMEDPNIEDMDISPYDQKVNEAIEIFRVLDRFPMKRIEGYLRKKKIDNLNRINEPSESMGMDMGPSSSGI